ncbi:HET-domain-containing protein [Melanomma pulvis-pyrius CBS 109.77]|uniref:HET-domain-containing protein n=1 Tax=Melanomma pulvis-pyrius CBS 109.77 TaxID=1314802 RepID=A0A6A6XH62_9PLEO|nr:HET-domain-containing protein [Melanomma pulvis-pyrius CBS 109.77]
MKLCNYCQTSVLASPLSWDEHHLSYSSLVASSEWESDEDPPSATRSPLSHQHPGRILPRCLFCWTLRSDIEALGPGLKDEKRQSEWPLYRWSIRSLARIRESGETVVVTFRQIVREEGEYERQGQGEAAEIELPTRTFYLFPEDDLGSLPTAKELSPSTNPSISGGHQIKKWVETCNVTHPGCFKRRRATSGPNQFIPTRLLDISGPPKSPIRVIETAATPVRGPYISLSHCWGLLKFVELKPETRKQFMEEGVPWSLFTKNFQEAIEVARFLDVGYIWIDSLCIIQGPDGDFMSEANKMHQVYRNSYCNVAIVDSQDSRGGLFRERDPNDVLPVRYQPKELSAMFGKKAWRAVPEDLWDSELLQTFLYRRGWVFQERMLAPRILHFANRQVFWDCPSLSACETLPAGLPQPMDGAAGPDRHWRGRLQEPEESQEPLAGANDDSLEAFWKTAVRKYTSCALTKGRDKLIAMWGIAKLVRDAMGVEYGAGLWEKNLEDQLAWRVAECTMEVRPSESTDEWISRDIPSWSWASMDGAIEVPDHLTIIPHYTVKDHFHRPLAFDLVGVKRYAPMPRLSDEAPPTQTRGMSDGIVEIQKRYKELKKEELESGSTAEHQKIEKVDKDAEPRFHSRSIQIQGHVGRAPIEWDNATKRWLLRLPGLSQAELQVFPDTKPKIGVLVDEKPYFCVLSAKQVNKPTNTLFDGVNENLEEEIKELGDYAEPEDYSVNSDFLVSGVGILMKDAGNHHFRRTGALYFRNASRIVFEKMQETYESRILPIDKYDAKYGRKFWLD